MRHQICGIHKSYALDSIRRSQESPQTGLPQEAGPQPVSEVTRSTVIPPLLPLVLPHPPRLPQ